MKAWSEWTQASYRLTVLRAVCVMAAMLYPVYWYASPGVAGSHDSLVVRFALSALFLAVLAASYLWPRSVARHYDAMVLVMALVMVTHSMHLAVRSDLHYYYVASVCGVIACIGTLLNSSRYMACLAAVSFLLALEGLRFLPVASALTFASVIAAVGIVCTLAAEWRHRSTTYLQNALRAVAESEARFSRLADSSPMMIWMSDAKGNPIYFSRTWRDFVGTKPDDLLREVAQSSIHPQDQSHVLLTFREAVATRQPFEVEYWQRRADGEYRYVLSRGVPRFSDGAFEGFVGNIVDLTERHRAEEEKDELRSRIAIASQLAALGEMAGGIAHEINNPLMIIDAYVRRLVRSLEQEPVDRTLIERMAERIVETVARIAGIVRSMRSLSRQVQQDELEPASLEGMIQDALAMCAERCRNDGIELRVELKQDVIVHCRPGQISQVILNLLGNASDAVLGLQNAWVCIGVEERPDEIEIHVMDNGGGVPSEVRDKIFQPFFTTKAVGKGTGLGLSISKNIIEAHGGRIALDSVSSTTRFIVVLPKDPRKLQVSS